MKIQHTIAFFLLVAASLTSCEMKDEIFDKNKVSGDTGYLNLAVSVQDKATRAATDEGTNNNSPVSADNFEVEINNSEGTYEKNSIPTQSCKLPENRTTGRKVYHQSTYSRNYCS